MFGDKSNRTSRIAKNAISIVAATCLMTIGSIGYAFGSMKFNTVVAKSSTPIGSEMTFYRSNSRVVIKDIYTDKNQDVLIARLNDGVGSRLPYKGSDFRIYISSKSTDGLKEMPVLFGRMSTDGDMFLIIPNPTKSVYSIFLMNTNYLGVQSINDNLSSTADINQGSITKALSSYRYSDTQSNSGTYKIDNDNMDVISFRLTIDPAFDNDQYRPKVINDKLLITNEDGTQTFEFEKFFDKVFKESAIADNSKSYDDLNVQKAQLEKVIEENASRLAENSNDSTAKMTLEQAKSQLDEVKSKQASYAKKISDYKLLTYQDSYFTDLQTKAIIVPTQK